MCRKISLAALAFIVAAACQEERPAPAVFRIADAEPWITEGTRSLLTASDIENRKTDITLAAYAEGALAAAGHYETGLETMELDLEPDRSYTVYALVNMGDMTSTITLLESDLNKIIYRIPSYTDGKESLSSRGLPMAGSLSWPSQGTVIPVKRLLSKVTAHLSCDWDGASIQEVRVCNLNRTLRPFGDAVHEEDWDQQEFHEGTGSSSGTFVFYVPENRQGTIEGIETSGDKSPDRNTAVESRHENLTYLEASVTSSESAIAGDIKYRSYLGGNATTDFDIVRNGIYDWTVVYHSDQTQSLDWKRDGDIFRIDLSADRTEAFVGETVYLTAICHRSDHGKETDADVTLDTQWTRVDGGSSSLRMDKGEVTATSPGSASFHAAYTLDGHTAWADSPVITFLELPPLSVSWYAKVGYVGQRGCLYVDGLADGSTITSVTSSNDAVAAYAATSGNLVFVNYTGAGEATFTITASNGQCGTFAVSPAAPFLLDSHAAINSNGVLDYYGHPDGTDANTQPSGHGGLLPAPAYYSSDRVSPSTRMSIGSDPSPTTIYSGKQFAPDLYEEILKPVIDVSNPSRFGCDGSTRIWVKSLAGYPSAGGVNIGTFTVSPKRTDCGITPLTEPILSVDPFGQITEITTWPDFNDKEMIAKYVECEAYSKTVAIPGSALTDGIDWDVKLAGQSNETMKALFSNNGTYLWFEYEEGDILPHIGGDCEVQLTVTNPYDGKEMAKTFVSFKVIVWGVYGGVVTVDRSSTFTVAAGYLGPEAAKPAGNLFSTSYTDGETLMIYGASGSKMNPATVSRDSVPHSLGQTIYSAMVDNGTAVVNEAQVYRSIHSEVTWPGAPTGNTYYRVENLEIIQDKVIHPSYHPGWIIPD